MDTERPTGWEREEILKWISIKEAAAETYLRRVQLALPRLWSNAKASRDSDRDWHTAVLHMKERDAREAETELARLRRLRDYCEARL